MREDSVLLQNWAFWHGNAAFFLNLPPPRQGLHVIGFASSFLCGWCEFFEILFNVFARKDHF
ncbi:MAG: hypothetical protein AUK31_07525 [Fibrobacteres bacterium CG2_30_45_31]|nr:MAG: hypothetical protein AUK31_07525 [Fibrobacteres bacterium CG2_30_45_31]